MANLFFIYTPFQLYTAQEIIVQEKLNNNILLVGCISEKSNCKDIYNYLKIESCWEKDIFMDHVNNWLDVDLYHPLRSVYRIIKDYNFINNILKKHYIDTIYFGDINNRSHRVATMIFSNRGIKIRFFEEGVSHYAVRNIDGILSHRPFIGRLYQILFDIILYIPIFHKPLGKVVFLNNPSIKNLMIDARYSIIPIYAERFDRALICQGSIGQRAIDYIKSECKSFYRDNNILFLDQPIYEIVSGSYPYYLQTIREYFNRLPRDLNIVIKYHPRQTDLVKQQVEDIFISLGFSFRVISSNINLPVEFYLQRVKFKKVINFFSSSSYYNGYLYPPQPFKYLINEFYEKCSRKISPHAIYGLEKLIETYKLQIKE